MTSIAQPWPGLSQFFDFWRTGLWMSAADESGSGTSGAGVGTGYHHLSVMREEITNWLRPSPGKCFFDGTLGAGGHSEALLAAGAAVVACDQDPDALDHARRRLEAYGDRFTAVRGNFAEMDAILAAAGIPAVDGIVLDLGVSSWQIDSARRGFSFQKDGPLDMRMDPAGAVSAATLVNEADETELARIFYEYGEERASRRVARAIVAARARGPIERTLALADIVASVLQRGGAKHPATRVFQALRIAVNSELEKLEQALEKTARCLKPGGVLAVLTFHSLEDRIVKHFLRSHSDKTLDRPEWAAPRINESCFFDLPVRKALLPGPAEQAANPRSRSAKLRLAVRR